MNDASGAFPIRAAMPKHTTTQHLLAEYHGCDVEFLDDVDLVQTMLRQAAWAAGATIVAETFHRFVPQGVTGVVVLQESHLSIHTWPEAGYAAVDFFTCGECTPECAHRHIARAIRAQRAEVMTVRRGILPPRRAMVVERHELETDIAHPGQAQRLENK